MNNINELCLWEKIVKMYQRTNFVYQLQVLRSITKIAPLKMEHDIWQPIFDQPL